ncbi:MAG: ribosome maturation factor RimM [Muribaculum sp.]|nr:ribosome maturation factor RimM [Muribaculum sp.]
MIKEETLKAVGKFQKTHGLKGELNVMLSINSEFFEEGNPMIVNINGIFVPFYAETIRPKGSTTDLVKIEGIDNEEEARKLVNKEVYALTDTLMEFMQADEATEIYDPMPLIGMKVTDVNLGPLGTVIDINDHTVNVLLIVETTDNRQVFIPMAADFIRSIDIQTRTIEVDVPEDLLTLN